MKHAKSLPSFLQNRYHGWRRSQFAENKALYAKLVDEGQHPHALVIACCDSRVHVTSVFGTEIGEFFIHRNIANLVPEYAPDGDNYGTSAAIEYAVTALGVTNILVAGHSQCGGVKGCYDMCSGNAPALEDKSSFVGKWVNILRPAYTRVIEKDGSAEEHISALEREGVLMSLENLMTYPFVKDRVERGDLALHGVWMDIRDGGLEVYNTETCAFEQI